MKFKKFITYLMAASLAASISVPAFAEEPMPEEIPEVPVEETGFIEGETGEDIFDSIVDANKGEIESDTKTDIEKEPEIEEIELTSKQALAVSLMKSLGVFEANIDLTSNFTRARLAHAIYILTDSTFVSDSAINTFADINSDTEYVNEISVLYDLGYITGYMGQYRPNDIVTAVEIAAVINRALGVEFVADYKGGWAAGHMSAAADYNIFDGSAMPADKTITTLDAAIIFTNFLNAKINKNEYNQAGIEGYYMSAVLDIYKVTGIVTDNGITSLDESETISGTIKIDGALYNSNGVNCEQYLGKKVDMYYRDIDGTGYVLAISVRDNQEVIHINSEDVEDFSSRTYTYYDGLKKKTARLASDYNIVYNGRLVTDGTMLTDTSLTPDEGFVELIDNDNDREYDLVIVEDYVTFVVEEYNANTNILRSQNNKVPAIEFEKADIDIKIMLGANGSTISVDYRNIGHNGYVLSVARSLDNRVVKIYMAEESVTGYVGSLDTDNKTVTVDGKEYIASRYLDEAVVIGGSYKLNINHYGHIIWGERIEATNDKLAYLHKAYTDETGEKITVELYTEDNSWFKASFSSKITIDGGTYSKPDLAEAAIQNAIESLVIFRANSNNEIVRLDTPDFKDGEKSDYSLNLIYENTSDAAFDANTLSFGELYQSKSPTDFNTKVFCVKDPYEDGKIYCYTLNDFKTKYVTTAESKIGRLWHFNTNQDSMIGTVALVKREHFGTSATDGESGTNLRVGAIVTNIKQGVNEDNDIEYVLTVEREGQKADIRLEKEALKFNTSAGTYTAGGNNPYTIGKGDLVRWGLNDDGVVEAGNIIVLYDCDADWFNTSSSWTTRYRYQNRWHYMWIYDKEDDHILSVNQSVSPIEKFDRGETEFARLHTYVDYTMPLNGQPISIWVYEKENHLLYQGDLGDFVTYKDAGLDCTRVIGRYNSGHRLYIIYK